MLSSVNLYEAKTRLSALVDQAAAGSEVIIAKHGKPLAKLVPFRVERRRRPGSARKQIRIGKNFDAPLPARVLAAFAAGETD